jgi:hypothetical protein
MSPAARKTTARSTTKRRAPSKEPAALRRLNKSLDSAQEALAELRGDVSKDVSAGARTLYKDVQRFIKEARRDSTKFGKTLQRDVEQAQKRLSSAAKRGTSRSGAGKASRRPAAKKPAARRTTTSRSRSR